MTTIHQLPNEILDRIFHYFTKFESFDNRMMDFLGQRHNPIRTRSLRLVCKRWAEIILNHHMFKRIFVICPSEYEEFIELFRKQPSLPPPCCLDLVLFNSFEPQQIYCAKRSEETVAVMKLFSRTVVTLEIMFSVYDTLDHEITKQLSSMINLKEIKLISDELTYQGLKSINRIERCQKNPFDFGWMAALIMANHRLRSLDMSNLICVFPKTFKSHLATNRIHAIIPAITQLSFDLENQPLDGIFDLCYAVKSSLKALTIKGKPCRTQSERFVQFFEDFRPALEGLSLGCGDLIEKIGNLVFPKLRICMMYHWAFGGDVPAKLWDSPIEVLVLQARSTHEEYKSPPRAFLKLRRLILTWTLAPPEDLSKMCQEGGVELVCLLGCNPHDFLSSTLGLLN